MRRLARGLRLASGGGSAEGPSKPAARPGGLEGGDASARVVVACVERARRRHARARGLESAGAQRTMAGVTGLEPVTSGCTGDAAGPLGRGALTPIVPIAHTGRGCLAGRSMFGESSGNPPNEIGRAWVEAARCPERRRVARSPPGDSPRSTKSRGSRVAESTATLDLRRDCASSSARRSANDRNPTTGIEAASRKGRPRGSPNPLPRSRTAPGPWRCEGRHAAPTLLGGRGPPRV